MTDKGSPTTDGNARQTLVTNFEASRLHGVATEHFTSFKRQSDLYEKQITEKKCDPGVDVTPTSYKASIDDSLTSIFITAGWIKAESMEDVREEHLKECARKRASLKPEGNDFTRIENIVRKVRMDVSLKDPEDRMWTFHYMYITTFQSHGLHDLPENKPHISIKHILSPIKPVKLRDRTKDIVE
ncbi:unnamed protein product [Agarophyton chilense]